MKKMFVFAAVLAVAALASAPVLAATVFTENFDNSLNGWTSTNVTYPATWDSAVDYQSSPTSGSAKLPNSGSRLWKSIGTDVSGYMKATWYIYDNSGTATRAFGEARGYTGTPFSGTLNQCFAAGKYNQVTMAGEVFSGSVYQGRLVYGSTSGWFNLSGISRSAGWHKFDVERLADDAKTVNFYVDDTLSRTFTGVTAAGINTIAFGNAAGTTAGDAWYDGISVINAPAVPEPSSLLALGTGLIGVLGVIRRRMA